MEEHQDEANSNRESRKPAKNLSALSFRFIHRLPVGKDFSKREARCKASSVRPVIDPKAAPNAENEQEN